MAKNLSYKSLGQVTLPVPEETKSGDPVVVGGLAGTALVDPDQSGNTEVMIRPAPVFAHTVKAIDGDGNSAIAKGDKLYYDAGATPSITKDDSGSLYGYAYGVVPAGATATIDIILA